MTRTFKCLLLPALAALLATAGCGGGGKKDTAAGGPPTAQHKNLFGRMPRVMDSPDNPVTDAKVTLGRMLYYDARLSAGGDISCNSCHDLAEYGVDGLPTSPGHDGTLGTRNSPTVYNAALQFAQFWDGRAATVEEQAKGPILNPIEHGMPSAEAVEKVLRDIPGYRPLFAAAFPGEAEPITFDNVVRAIGAFERKLVTRGRWDRWLVGDGTAITAQERRGVDTFIEVGCTTCHMGPLVGGTMFQKLGLVEPYPTKDKGRGEVTGNATDDYFFKVPQLRNVAETGPYLHDGSVEDLAEMVRLMGKHQLGKELTDAQVSDIMAFLKMLTGKIPTDFIAEPALPGAAAQ